MLQNFQESDRWSWHHPRLQEKERDGERDINKIEDDEVDSQENRDWSPVFFPIASAMSHPTQRVSLSVMTLSTLIPFIGRSPAEEWNPHNDDQEMSPRDQLD